MPAQCAQSGTLSIVTMGVLASSDQGTPVLEMQHEAAAYVPQLGTIPARVLAYLQRTDFGSQSVADVRG